MISSGSPSNPGCYDDTWRDAVNHSAYTPAGRAAHVGRMVASVGRVTSRPRPTTAATGLSRGPTGPGRPQQLPARTRLALGVSALGAVLALAAPLTTLVTPQVPAGFRSWPVLALIAVAPVAVAGWFAVRGRPVATSAVLTSVALFAPGRALLDAQLVSGPNLAARPELLLPASLLPYRPSVGVVLLLIGHALTLLAGLLAYRDEPSATPTWLASESGAGPDGADGRARNDGRFALGLGVAGLTAVALTALPFRSDRPLVLPTALFDAGIWVLAGDLLIVVAVLVAAGLAISSIEPDAVTGGLTGAAVAVTGIALPALLAGLLVPGLHVTWGPPVALLAAAGFLVMARFLRCSPTDQRTGEPADVELPSQARLHLVAGVLAVLAGAAALLAGWAPLVDSTGPAGVDVPQFGGYAGRPLLPAGLIMVLLGAALLSRRIAAAVRPAVAVASVTVFLAGAAALDSALTVLDTAQLSLDNSNLPAPLGGGVQVTAGLGLWSTGLAVLAAIAAACCAGLAGTAERAELDLSELEPNRVLTGPGVVAGLAALGAFGLPVLTAPGYLPPDLWSHFRTASWGLLAGLVAVLVAVALAPRCRPSGAAVLLLGAATVPLVRGLELPLTAGRAAGSGPGLGLWFAVATVLALLVGAGLAFRSARQPSVRHPEETALSG